MKILKKSGGIPLINYLVLAAAVVGATSAAINTFENNLKTDLDNLAENYVTGSNDASNEIGDLDVTPDGTSSSSSSSSSSSNCDSEDSCTSITFTNNSSSYTNSVICNNTGANCASNFNYWAGPCDFSTLATGNNYVQIDFDNSAHPYGGGDYFMILGLNSTDGGITHDGWFNVRINKNSEPEMIITILDGGFNVLLSSTITNIPLVNDIGSVCIRVY